MTDIALPVLERIDGYLRVEGSTSLVRLQLPALKEIAGGTSVIDLASTSQAVDLSRLRTLGAEMQTYAHGSVDVATPCLDTRRGLSISDGSGPFAAPLYAPRLRLVDGYLRADLEAPRLESISGFIAGGDIVAPVLTSVGGTLAVSVAPPTTGSGSTRRASPTSAARSTTTMRTTCPRSSARRVSTSRLRPPSTFPRSSRSPED